MPDFSTVVVTQQTQAVVLSTVQQVVQVNSAVPGSYDLVARLGMGLYNVREYGARGDGSTDDTAAFAAALLAASSTSIGSKDRQATVWVPPGWYRISQITIPVGVSLIGAGTTVGTGFGSLLHQIAGSQRDMILVAGNVSSNASNTEISRLGLLGTGSGNGGGGTDTIGSGIAFLTGASTHSMRIMYLEIRNFPEHGIKSIRRGVPIRWHDLFVWDCNGYGIYFAPGTEGAPVNQNTQLFHLFNIDVDDNALGGIYISNAFGNSDDTFLLDSIKIEKSQDGRQNYGIVLDSMKDCPVTIRAASSIDAGVVTVPMAGLIRLTTADPPQLTWESCRAENVLTPIVVDSINSVTVPNNLYSGRYHPEINHFAVVGTTPQMRMMELDAATDEGLTEWRQSGGLTQWFAINDDGTIGGILWDADRTGSAWDYFRTRVPLRVHSTTAALYAGTGSPEGVVTAPLGSVYHRTDGGRGTSYYVKELGATANGWIALMSASQTAIRTVVSTDSPVTLAHNVDRTVFADATGGAITINLPSATATLRDGIVFVVIKTDSSGNAVTLDANSTQTINGALTYPLTTQYQKVTIQSDGANWFVVG